MKNNDQRVADDAQINNDGHLKNKDQYVADDEDVDNEGYLRNNDQRGLNLEANGGYLKMTNSSANDNGYLQMNGSSLGEDGYLKITVNSKQGSLQRAPTSL